MPRVISKVARKAYPAEGIKKGDTYYTWKFYKGRKQRSLNRPKQSQLTQRADYGALRRAQEIIDEQDWNKDKRPDLVDAMGDVIGSLEEARDAAQEKYDNLPENWQQADQGQNLETFVSECEDAISEIEGIRDDLADDEKDFDEIDDPSSIAWPNEV